MNNSSEKLTSSSYEKKVINNNNNILKSKSIQEKSRRNNNNINLCKKYFYMRQPKNIIRLNKINNETILEKIDNIITKLEKKREELNNTKIDCIKSMILSNKKIPENWIMKSDYKNILENVMKDDIVLNYAIVCKDIYKKRSSIENDNDDTKYENYIKSLPQEKKFISYINPYTKNYIDTTKKKILMKEYDNKLNKEKEKEKEKKICSYSYKKIDKLPKIKNEEYKNNFKNNINRNKNKYKFDGINNITTINETKNDLMLTSLHYTGLDLDNNNINQNNRKKLEIKLPEITVI